MCCSYKYCIFMQCRTNNQPTRSHPTTNIQTTILLIIIALVSIMFYIFWACNSSSILRFVNISMMQSLFFCESSFSLICFVLLGHGLASWFDQRFSLLNRLIWARNDSKWLNRNEHKNYSIISIVDFVASVDFVTFKR